MVFRSELILFKSFINYSRHLCKIRLPFFRFHLGGGGWQFALQATGGLAQVVRGQMGITHGHGNVAVPQEFGNREQGSAVHDQPTGESVAERVKNHLQAAVIEARIPPQIVHRFPKDSGNGDLPASVLSGKNQRGRGQRGRRPPFGASFQHGLNFPGHIGMTIQTPVF